MKKQATCYLANYPNHINFSGGLDQERDEYLLRTVHDGAWKAIEKVPVAS
jgi:hypothetical protein